MSDVVEPEIRRLRLPKAAVVPARSHPRIRRDRERSASGDRMRRGEVVRGRSRASGVNEVDVATALVLAGTELHATLDTQEILRRHCELSRKQLGGSIAHTYLLDAQTDTMILRARVSAGAASRGVRAEIPRQDVASLLSLLDREEVVTSWDQLDGTQCLARVASQSRVRAIVVVGLRRNGEMQGFHVVSYRDQEIAFTDSHREIARGLAAIASVALANAQRHEDLLRMERTRSEFLSVLSHELRSPLHVILGYGSLLLEGDLGELSPVQSDAMRRIGRNARQLTDVIDNTLCLMRDEAGRLGLWERDVRPKELLDEIRQETLALFSDRPISFAWDVPEDLPALHTDPTKLKVVLRNLVGNAVKFTDRGEVRVTALERAGGVELSVADTGSGIAPEMLEAIFEQFRQGGPVDQGRGGVGLGLYIVRCMLDRLGGRISVQSALGKGSEFKVWLPLTRA